jgi:ketosteroid isomerase-like protein
VLMSRKSRVNNPASSRQDEDQVRDLLEQWARATREGRQAEVFENHASDVLIYDVLPPMKYEGAAAYRRSWDEWQPDTQGEGQFAFQDLSIICGTDVAFAHGFIQCGGTLLDGTAFEDLIRATFCLRKIGEAWKVVHQHMSKPFESNDND